MADPTCAGVRELLAEVALGIASTEDSEAAAVHLEGCAACRAELRQMGDVADALPSLAPDANAPPGFEARVLASLGLVAQPNRRAVRSRTRVRLAAAAGAAALALAAAGVAGWLVGRPGGQHAHPVALLSGELHSGPRDAGQVVVSMGGEPWVSVAVWSPTARPAVICQLETAGGRTVPVGSFVLNSGYSYWAAPVPPGIDAHGADSVVGARLVGAGGAVLAQATVKAG